MTRPELPQARIAAVGERFLHVCETSENRGPHIEEFWRRTTYCDGAKNREPWCSAFASFCVDVADDESEGLNFPLPPVFPAVVQWEPWAKMPHVGAIIFHPSKTRLRVPQRGDIAIFLPYFSHVGIVTHPYDGSGYVKTVEGNTNEAGAREGKRVMRQLRRISRIGCFIRLPARAVRNA